MNRASIRNLVVEATKREDKTSLINSAIDLAVREVSSQHLWSDLMVTADAQTLADSGSVTLASDLTRLTELRVIEGTLSRPIEIRPKTWVVSHFPDPESRSRARPVFGYLEGIVLWLVPWPNTEYLIRYSYCRLHPTLDADTDEVLIRHAEKAVIAYATYWVFQSIEKHVDAERWFRTYMMALDSAKKQDHNPAVQQLADIRGQPRGVPFGDYWLDPFVKRMP